MSYTAKKQAAKVNNSTSIYNYNSFADSIKQKMLDRETKLFSWEKLGRDCLHLFRFIPKFSVLYGPIGKDYVVKERKKSERVVDDTVVLSKVIIN